MIFKEFKGDSTSRFESNHATDKLNEFIRHNKDKYKLVNYQLQTHNTGYKVWTGFDTTIVACFEEKE